MKIAIPTNTMICNHLSIKPTFLCFFIYSEINPERTAIIENIINDTIIKINPKT